jgi:6-phosphogluconolactonase (cycloisomerase 2 family)
MNTCNVLYRNILRAITLSACIALSGVMASDVARADNNSENDISSPHVLYVVSNDTNPGQNAVLAYTISDTNGSLSLLGKFPTSGTGFSDFDGRLGGDDSDHEVILNADKTLLFAVNGGSDTIAVFKVAKDGNLTPVDGSPFPSHGPTPVSLGLSGNILVVVNANSNNIEGVPHGTEPANYTTFRVTPEGRLVHIPKPIELTSTANPVIVEISRDGTKAFGIDFLALPYTGPQILPFAPPFGSLLEAFTFANDGSLQRVPGAPFVTPVNARLIPSDPTTGYLLGFGIHPTQPILYSGETVTSRLAVYTFGDDGVPNFVTDVQSAGKAICWFVFSKDGRFLYATEPGTNSVAVFDIENPLAPVLIQDITMVLAGANPPSARTSPVQIPQRSVSACHGANQQMAVCGQSRNIRYKLSGRKQHPHSQDSV